MTDEERAILAELARRDAARAKATYCPHEPTAKQRAFLGYKGQEALYGGAAGGGKSDALLMGALEHVGVPGYSALLLRRSFADLALPGAIMDRAHTWLAGSDAHWSGVDKRWTFPSGATLTFGYLQNRDDHLRYQGAEFQYIGFDELTQFEERQYKYLFSRLRRGAGVDVPLRMRGATNPGGPGHAWVKGRFIVAPVGRAFFPATLDDNPHVDKKAYEDALAELDSVTRNQLRHGSWEQDTSTLVYAFDEHRDVIDALPSLPRGKRWVYVLGIDYGYGNATALVVWAFCTGLNDVSYMAESKKWTKLIPSAAAEVVQKWNDRYPFSRMVGDVGGLGKGYTEEGRVRFALPIEPAQKQNKLGFIRLMNGAYETERIKVVRSMNADYIEEAKGLPWKDDRQLEEMPGVPNHCLDGGLYGWRESRAFRRIEDDKNKPKLGTPEWHAQQDREAEAEEARQGREEREAEEYE